MAGEAERVVVVQAESASAFPNDTKNKRELLRACLAEFMAMVMFVFIGCGSVAATGEFLVDDEKQNVKVSVARVLPIATCFGIAIIVLAFSTAAISGGHINPAVTFALMLQRKISPTRMILYMISQFLGSVLGASLLWGGISNASYKPSPGMNITGFRPGIDIVPAVGKPPFLLGANQLNPVLSTSNGLLLEVMGTGMLVFTVLSTAVDNRGLGNLSSLAPLPIGISVWVVHLVLVPWTGCGINPARTFGPAVINSFYGTDTWDDSGVAVYFLGPMLGSALTVLLMQVLWGGMKPPTTSFQVQPEERAPDTLNGSLANI